jgi:hypothetical protein
MRFAEVVRAVARRPRVDPVMMRRTPKSWLYHGRVSAARPAGGEAFVIVDAAIAYGLEPGSGLRETGNAIHRAAAKALDLRTPVRYDTELLVKRGRKRRIAKHGKDLAREQVLISRSFVIGRAGIELRPWD